MRRPDKPAAVMMRRHCLTRCSVCLGFDEAEGNNQGLSVRSVCRYNSRNCKSRRNWNVACPRLRLGKVDAELVQLDRLAPQRKKLSYPHCAVQGDDDEWVDLGMGVIPGGRDQFADLFFSEIFESSWLLPQAGSLVGLE